MQQWLFDRPHLPKRPSPEEERYALHAFHNLFKDRYLRELLLHILQAHSEPNGPTAMDLWRAFVLGTTATALMLSSEQIAELVNRDTMILESLGHDLDEVAPVYTASQIEKLIQLLSKKTMHALSKLMLEVSLRGEEALLGLDDDPRPPLLPTDFT